MTIELAPFASRQNSFRVALAMFSHKMFEAIDDRSEKSRQIKQLELLAVLDPHMLEDIGVRNFHRLPRDQQMKIAHEIVSKA